MLWILSHFITIQQFYNFVYILISHCISLVLFYPVGIFLSICLLIFLRICFYIYREEIRLYVLLIDSYLEPIYDFYDFLLTKYKFLNTIINFILNAIKTTLYCIAIYIYVFNITYSFFLFYLLLNILGCLSCL
jgi:hypothetical protein